MCHLSVQTKVLQYSAVYQRFAAILACIHFLALKKYVTAEPKGGAGSRLGSSDVIPQQKRCWFYPYHKIQILFAIRRVSYTIY